MSPVLSRLVKNRINRKAQGRADESPSLQKMKAGPTHVRRSPSPWTPPPASPDPATSLEPSTFALLQDLPHSSQNDPRYSTMIPQVKASSSGMQGNHTKSHSSSPTRARSQGLRDHVPLGQAVVPQPQDDSHADSPLSTLMKLCSAGLQLLDTYQSSTTFLSDPPISSAVQTTPSASTSTLCISPSVSTTQLPKGDLKFTPVTAEACSSLIRRGAIRGRPNSQRSQVQTRHRNSSQSTLHFFSQVFR